jgi:hypothetical protein
MSIHAARTGLLQAHPASPIPDWPEPRRRRLQYPAAVGAYTVLVLGLIAAILALGGIAGAVFGIDMR